MIKKYELLEDDTHEIGNEMLFRIRALRNFGDVKEGDLGGYIASEENLSHDGNCWAYDNSCVFNKAVVSDDAKIADRAWADDHSKIYNKATVQGNSHIGGTTEVYGWAKVGRNSKLVGDDIIKGESIIDWE